MFISKTDQQKMTETHFKAKAKNIVGIVCELLRQNVIQCKTKGMEILAKELEICQLQENKPYANEIINELIAINFISIIKPMLHINKIISELKFHLCKFFHLCTCHMHPKISHLLYENGIVHYLIASLECLVFHYGPPPFNHNNSKYFQSKSLPHCHSFIIVHTISGFCGDVKIAKEIMKLMFAKKLFSLILQCLEQTFYIYTTYNKSSRAILQLGSRMAIVFNVTMNKQIYQSMSVSTLNQLNVLFGNLINILCHSEILELHTSNVKQEDNTCTISLIIWGIRQFCQSSLSCKVCTI